MAIYHLSVKPVSRGEGRSATACAAYRAGERIEDRTTGQVFDYGRKRGIEHSDIVLSTAAAKQDIQWARDRQELWNRAEEAERRKDGRPAREYVVALAHELTPQVRHELVQDFAVEIANRYNVAVDYSIHRPDRQGDNRNHHAHLLTTTREITATGLGAKASIEWSDKDRAKRGLSPAKEEIKAIRERWATLTNEKLQEHGHTSRIDHRSLEAQGIERDPTRHKGPAITAIERQGERSQVAERWRYEDQAEALRRLAHAAEIGRLEREIQQVSKTILDLSADLAVARRERDAQLTSSPTPAAAVPGPARELTLAERFRARVEQSAERVGQDLKKERSLDLVDPSGQKLERTQEKQLGRDLGEDPAEREKTREKDRGYDFER